MWPFKRRTRQRLVIIWEGEISSWEESSRKSLMECLKDWANSKDRSLVLRLNPKYQVEILDHHGDLTFLKVSKKP